jgi:hypothetical protein
LVVPDVVTEALIDHGFAAVTFPGLYPMYTVSPYVGCTPSAPEYFKAECEPRYIRGCPAFSNSSANTLFAIVATPARSNNDRRKFLMI